MINKTVIKDIGHSLSRCEKIFNDAIKASGGAVKVYDIVELVAKSI